MKKGFSDGSGRNILDCIQDYFISFDVCEDEICEHENTVEVDDGIFCWDCETIVAIPCQACWGTGDVYEDD